MNSLRFMKDYDLKSSRELIEIDVKNYIKDEDIASLVMTNLILKDQQY